MAVAFIVLVALVAGLVAANAAWRDPHEGRRVLLTLFCGGFIACAGAAAAWGILLLIEVARVDPIALVYVAAGLYALMAGNVAWEHVRRQGFGLGALLLGVFWLPVFVLMRRSK